MSAAAKNGTSSLQMTLFCMPLASWSPTCRGGHDGLRGERRQGALRRPMNQMWAAARPGWRCRREIASGAQHVAVEFDLERQAAVGIVQGHRRFLRPELPPQAVQLAPQFGIGRGAVLRFQAARHDEVQGALAIERRRRADGLFRERSRHPRSRRAPMSESAACRAAPPACRRTRHTDRSARSPAPRARPPGPPPPRWWCRSAPGRRTLAGRPVSLAQRRHEVGGLLPVIRIFASQRRGPARAALVHQHDVVVAIDPREGGGVASSTCPPRPVPGPPASRNSGAAALRRLSAGTTATLKSMPSPPGWARSRGTLSAPQRAAIEASCRGCSSRHSCSGSRVPLRRRRPSPATRRRLKATEGSTRALNR